MRKERQRILFFTVYSLTPVVSTRSSQSQQLNASQCLLTEHQWTEEEWDTTQIGFVTGMDPNFYTLSQAQVKFNQEICKRIEVSIHNTKRIKIP